MPFSDPIVRHRFFERFESIHELRFHTFLEAARFRQAFDPSFRVSNAPGCILRFNLFIRPLRRGKSHHTEWMRTGLRPFVPFLGWRNENTENVIVVLI